MAPFSISICFTMLTFLIFHLKMLTADPSSSFSFESFEKNPNFESNIALYGDAKVVDDGSSIQLTHSVSSSGGRVMYKKPIKLVEGNPGNLISFSTYFSFLMSPDYGGGFGFVMLPNRFDVSVFDNTPFGLSLGSKKGNSKIIAVEFDSLKDARYGDLNENHVGIDVGGFISVKVRNVSTISAGLTSGKKLHSWIDYEAGSKRLEVRLSQSGDTKPIDPSLSHAIDLSKLWNDEEVLIGFSSSNGNSSQMCFLCSWSFKLRQVPHWMHSQPLDPHAFALNLTPVDDEDDVYKRSDCFWKVLAAMTVGTVCGALGAFIVIYLWTMFGYSRTPVVPVECSVNPMDFEYKKVKVVVDKAVEEDAKQ